MAWNWEQPDWPGFRYKVAEMERLERQFLLNAGTFVGAFKHVEAGDRELLKIELISDEALKTSAIEGEILNRHSVQSSLLHQFGLGPAQPRIPAAERGIAEMMVDLYKTFAQPLTGRALFRWHGMLLRGTGSVGAIGSYRRHADAMQVVSGPDYRRRVHFEAPPSGRMAAEMKAFITWFNDTAPGSKRPLQPVTRAGIAHIYFVSIHPFEDGNGRIGRAIAEKALAQGLGQPSLIALAYAIERKRKDYYGALERNNKGTEITDWLTYFGDTILEAQHSTIERVEFLIAKARLYERVRGELNGRQAKALGRMFREGVDGFKGGMTAEEYIVITRTSRATATRDLQDLVAKGALSRTGELRGTRYHLRLAGDEQ